MAITRACIDRFRASLAQSFSTWQPIRWFNVKGSKVKVTAYVTDSTASLRNLWVYLTYLTWAVGVSTATRRLMVARRKYTRRPKTIFSNQTNPKNPERLARCRSAFEMQCFRICTLPSLHYSWHSKDLESHWLSSVMALLSGSHMTSFLRRTAFTMSPHNILSHFDTVTKHDRKEEK